MASPKLVPTRSEAPEPKKVDYISVPNHVDDWDEYFWWICHAEQNAIINAARMGVAVRGASIYVTKFPCLGCCNSIIQAGIRRIYTLDDWYWDNDPFDGKRQGNHWRKRRAIRQTHIIVDAPNDPEYSPFNVSARKPPRRETNVTRRNGTGRNGTGRNGTGH